MHSILIKTFKFSTQVAFEKERFLNLALLHASNTGFTERSIIQSCIDFQITPAANSLIKPSQLIHFAMRKWNLETVESVKKTEFEKLQLRTKIKYLIQERLRHQIPYMNRWNEAMAIGAHPQNIQETIGIISQFADDAWYLSGDKDQNQNLHSNRLMFLYIYIGTEFQMLTDKSLDYMQTWEFLERRIEEVTEMGTQIEFSKNLLNVLSNSGYYLLTIFKSIPK